MLPEVERPSRAFSTALETARLGSAGTCIEITRGTDGHFSATLRPYRRPKLHLHFGPIIALPTTALRPVTVKGRTVPAGRQGRYWNDEITVPNALQAWRGPVTIFAAARGTAGSPDAYRVDSRMVEVAASLQNYTYDADGNLTGDGLVDYTWDAENRLVRIETDPSAISLGFPHRLIEFKYDYLGRRVQKRVVDVDQNAELYCRRYLYDGWNLIAEYLSPGGTTLGSLVRSYTWGLDIALSMTNAGGVGALLQIADHPSGKTYVPTYDGNGNIISLLNADTGALAAAYEYSPFGEPLRAQTYDPTVADNPFRFSTKWTDLETGLLYYGHRYYDPHNGRFINRDPIEEQGGLNLYGFCGNNALNKYDLFGNDPSVTILGKQYTVISVPAASVDITSFRTNYPGAYWSWDPTFTVYYSSQTGFGSSAGFLTDHVYIAIPVTSGPTQSSLPARNIATQSPQQRQQSWRAANSGTDLSPSNGNGVLMSTLHTPNASVMLYYNPDAHGNSEHDIADGLTFSEFADTAQNEYNVSTSDQTSVAGVTNSLGEITQSHAKSGRALYDSIWVLDHGRAVGGAFFGGEYLTEDFYKKAAAAMNPGGTLVFMNCWVGSSDDELALIAYYVNKYRISVLMTNSIMTLTKISNADGINVAFFASQQVSDFQWTLVHPGNGDALEDQLDPWGNMLKSNIHIAPAPPDPGPTRGIEPPNLGVNLLHQN